MRVNGHFQQECKTQNLIKSIWHPWWCNQTIQVSFLHLTLGSTVCNILRQIYYTFVQFDRDCFHYTRIWTRFSCFFVRLQHVNMSVDEWTKERPTIEINAFSLVIILYVPQKEFSKVFLLIFEKYWNCSIKLYFTEKLFKKIPFCPMDASIENFRWHVYP